MFHQLLQRSEWSSASYEESALVKLSERRRILNFWINSKQTCKVSKVLCEFTAMNGFTKWLTLHSTFLGNVKILTWFCSVWQCLHHALIKRNHFFVIQSLESRMLRAHSVPTTASSQLQVSLSFQNTTYKGKKQITSNLHYITTDKSAELRTQKLKICQIFNY